MSNIKNFRFKNRKYEETNYGVFSIVKEDDSTYSLNITQRWTSELTYRGFKSFDMAYGYAMCLTNNAVINEQ